MTVPVLSRGPLSPVRGEGLCAGRAGRPCLARGCACAARGLAPARRPPVPPCAGRGGRRGCGVPRRRPGDLDEAQCGPGQRSSPAPPPGPLAGPGRGGTRRRTFGPGARRAPDRNRGCHQRVCAARACPCPRRGDGGGASSAGAGGLPPRAGSQLRPCPPPSDGGRLPASQEAFLISSREQRS